MIYKTTDVLNIRLQPTIDSLIVGQLSPLTLVSGEKTDSWIRISNGYIHADYTILYDISDVQEIARGVNVDYQLLLALQSIESNGFNFQNNKLLIRFEVHIFQSYTKSDVFKHNALVPWTEHYVKYNNQWLFVHVSQQNEYVALEIAQQIHTEYAYRSISMGSGQVMGFNYSLLGFLSAQEMFMFASQSEKQAQQLFYRFLRTNKPLIKALQEKSWRDIAIAYNGYGNIDRYVSLLKQKYALLKD